MNREWYCTSTVIAQTTIVFSTSTYDMLKTKIWYIIKIAVMLLFCTTVCQQAHWTTLSLLQAKSCSRGNFQQQTCRRRLLATRSTYVYLVNQKYVKQRTRKRGKLISYFQLDKTSLKFFKDIDVDCRFDQELSMESATFMRKNFQDNRNSIVNTTDLTLKKMFDISAKLVGEQDEISNVDTIGWDKHSWKYLSLIGDETIINLQRAKVYVFSDSVLCLGKIHQHPSAMESWKEMIEWITTSQSYRDYDGNQWRAY